MTKKDIDNAIRTTLVVENKESIKYAVSKIMDLFNKTKSDTNTDV